MYQGGCLCGRVRFEADAEPVWPHLCSCPHCMALSGGPVVAWTGFPNEKFRWTGDEPDWYQTFPTTERGSCPTCHSLIAARDSEGEFANQMGITIMSLDKTDGIVPVHQSFKDNAVPWLPVIETIDS